MSSQSIVPDQSSPSNYVDQSSQNPPSSTLGNVVSQPASQPAPKPAPDPVNGNPSRLNNVLLRVASQPTPGSGGVASTNEDADNVSSGPGWKSVLGKVASVVSTGLAGVPAGGRSSFLGGLGEGARAAQAVKFASFNDQVRMAELHNQDLKMQNDTQAQTDAHTKAELDNRSLANSLGIDYDSIASHGPTVMGHLADQTAANGAASVPGGTHLTGDGEGVNIPQDTQKTRDGQKQMYNSLSGPLGLPSLPNDGKGMDFVPSKNMNMLMSKINGFESDGSTLKHEELPGAIGALQFKRDAMAKNGGASDAQLQAVDNRLGVLKANLSALDTHAATVKQSDAQATAAGTLAAQTSPDAIAAEGKKAAGVKQAQLDVENSPSNQAAQVKLAANKASAEEAAKGNDNLVVAYTPTYQNADGTQGANVVMTKGQAQVQGLQHYKADPAKLNATVAGFNDVQNKLNMLADVVNDPNRMGQVDPGLAARMLNHGKGLSFGASGFGSSVSVDTSRINEQAYAHEVSVANQPTRDFVTATIGAHEALTQLPRLQTFGQSSRTTQQQMEAAQNLLPHAGDGTMAPGKMKALQQMLDPLRKQVPHMQGAEQIPSWLEKQGQQQQTPQSVGRFNPQTQTIER